MEIPSYVTFFHSFCSLTPLIRSISRCETTQRAESIFGCTVHSSYGYFVSSAQDLFSLSSHKSFSVVLIQEKTSIIHRPVARRDTHRTSFESGVLHNKET